MDEFEPHMDCVPQGSQRVSLKGCSGFRLLYEKTSLLSSFPLSSPETRFLKANKFVRHSDHIDPII